MIDDATARRLLLTVAARTADSAEAFERLYRQCAPMLLGIALRIVRRRELADEVLHDAFLKIWHAAPSFDPTGAPIGWLVTITRHRALDLMATHDVSRVESYHDAPDDDPDGALDRLFDANTSAEDSADASRLSRWLRECLGELAAVERQSLVLAYEQGLSHGELAEHLRKPLGTVKSWVRRGLAHLRDCVETCMRQPAP
jgi:RNA polymerase sigma-70 factor (ECF subfamily)